MSWQLGTIGAIATVILIFLVSEFVGRRIIVYRRNKQMVLFPLLAVIAAIGFYTLGSIGVIAFIAGTAMAGWTWVSGIASANNRLHGKAIDPRAPRMEYSDHSSARPAP